MICSICPRRCGAERSETAGKGFCAMPAVPVVALASLHRWEEPCLSGTHGAGTVFFSGCNLRCSFCQNHIIRQENQGKPVSVSRLREIFQELAAKGAHNLDLVSPTQFTPWIAEALEPAPPLPVVWNCGGYESAETLRTLAGKVQIYLPDWKYAIPTLSAELSGASDYAERAEEAILEMYRQTGPYRFNEEGLLQSGVLIRHLMLPGQLENTKRVIDRVAHCFRPGEVLFSLLRQYTPQPWAEGIMARRVTGAEYRAACRYLEACGITDGYIQEAEAAESVYTPQFDGSGV